MTETEILDKFKSLEMNDKITIYVLGLLSELMKQNNWT